MHVYILYILKFNIYNLKKKKTTTCIYIVFKRLPKYSKYSKTVLLDSS